MRSASTSPARLAEITCSQSEIAAWQASHSLAVVEVITSSVSAGRADVSVQRRSAQITVSSEQISVQCSTMSCGSLVTVSPA